MESKALEKLGILKPKKTFGQRVRSFLIKVVVVLIMCACGWGVWGYLCHKGTALVNKPASPVKQVADQPAVKDDGSLFIREHLSAQRVAAVDTRTTKVAGRVVVTARNYWYRLSIDENWYYKVFIPRVKTYLDQIAPGAPAEPIELDTKELAYANDGADRLQRMKMGHIMHGDAFQWSAATPKTLEARQKRRQLGPNTKSVVVIDGTEDKGAVTRATVYSLGRAQFDKLESWISREVLRERADISAVISADGVELGSKELNTRIFDPIAYVHYCGSSYAISPWIDVQQGVRYWFVCVQCRHGDGILERVDEHWNL